MQDPLQPIIPVSSLDLNKAVDEYTSSANGFGTIPGVETNGKAAKPLPSAFPVSLDITGYQPVVETVANKDLAMVRGYNSFKENPQYNTSTDPMSNVREYAGKQGTTEWLGNNFAKLGITAKDSFINAFEQNGRNLEALTKWDANKLYSTSDGTAKADELRNLYPTYGTGQLDNSAWRFLPWNFGKSDFGGEMIPQLGFTVGTIGETLLENWLVGLAGGVVTGGAGTAYEVANTASKLGKVGQGLWKLFETSNGITQFKRGLSILNSIKNESSIGATLGQGIIKGGKLLANAYAMFNTAGGEAAFEANNTYVQQLQDLKDEFTSKNGHEPFGQDLEKIEESARKTGLATFGWNIPVLLGSNLIQFGNVLKPFKGVLAETTEDVAMNLAGKGLKKTISVAEKEIQSKFLRGATKVGSALLEPASEGLEEVAQSVGSTYASQYYKDLYNGLTPNTALNKSLNAVWGYAGSKAYQNDFFGGFIGGAVFKGVGAISKATGLQEKMGFDTDKSIADRKAKLTDQALEILNSTSNEDLIKYLFDPTVQNYVSQVANKEEMSRAAQLNDRLAFNDAKSKSVRDLIYAGLTTGKLDLALSKLDIFKELENDDLAKAINIQDKTDIDKATTTAAQTIEDIRERAYQLESEWNTINRAYKNPYKEGSEMYFAFEEAKKDRLFSKDAVLDTQRRARNLRADILSTSKVTDNVIDQAIDNNVLGEAIKDLDVFVKEAPDKNNLVYDRKKSQLSLLKEIQKEKSKKNPDYQKLAELTFDLGNINELNVDFGVDRDTNIGKIKDVLQLEDRHKANVGNYNFLNKQEINSQVIQHILAQQELLKNIKKPQQTPTTSTTTSNNPTGPTNSSASGPTKESIVKKLGKGYDIVEKNGKFEVKFSHKKANSIATETATLTFDTLEDIDKNIASIQAKFPQQPSSALTEDDLFESPKEELDKLLEPFKGLTKNPGQLAYTETRPPYENQVADNHPSYMHRIENFLNNLFYKRGRFSTNISIKSVPVTALNYRNVEQALGIPEDTLLHIVKQAGQQGTTTFKTAKGSVYTVNPLGTTIRNKSFHAEHGGDEGIKPESNRTFYVTKDELNKIGLVQATHPDDNTKFVIAQLPEGKIGVGIIGGKDNGKIAGGTTITPKNSPEIGLTPVEIWNNGTIHHFGNEITEVNKVNNGFNLSKENPNGHITNVYVEKDEDKYFLLDQEGERITSDYEDKIVQGRLVSSDVDLSKIRENTSEEDIKHIRDTNKKIREHFIANPTFQTFDFTFSNGISQNNDTASHKVTEVGLVEPKDITSKSIYIPAKKGTSIIESPDSYHTLLVGRPYLRIEGKNPDGSPFVQYQQLDNEKLSGEQVDAVVKALVGLSNLVENAGITELLTTEEFKYLQGVLQVSKNKAPQSKRAVSFYLSGKTLKSAFKNDKGVVIYVNTFAAPGIVNSDLLAFIKDRYHNVDKALLAEKFKDFQTGKRYNSYVEYLLASDNAPLTTRTNNKIKNDPNPTPVLPFIQRYSIIDYSSITKEKPVAKTKTYYSPVEVVKKKEPAKTQAENKQQNVKKKFTVYSVRNSKKQEKVEEEVEEFEDPGEPSSDNFDEFIADNADEPEPDLKGLKNLAKKKKFTATGVKAKAGKASSEPLEDIKPTKKSTGSTGKKRFTAAGVRAKAQGQAVQQEAEEAPSTEEKPKTKGKKFTAAGVKGKKGATSEQSSTPITGRDADNLSTDNEETKKGLEEIDKAFSAFNFYDESGNEVDPPFKLEDPSRTDPITEQEMEEVKAMLPKVGFSYNPELERVFQNRRVWGVYKNAVITLYKGAKRGTAYHEAIHVVLRSILKKSQTQSLFEEFRRRPGTFETYEGIFKGYRSATDKEVEESIADEFLDFKEGKPIPQAAPKNLFQRILSYITDFFNRILNRPTASSIEEVYRSLDEGVYGDVEIRDSTDEYFKLGEDVGQLTKYEAFESLRSFSAHLFQKIISDNKEILHALDEGQDATKLYDYLKDLSNNFYFKQNSDGSYDETSPNIEGMSLSLKQRFQYLNSVEGKDPQAAQAQILQEAKNAYIRWKDDILPNWEDFVQSHKNFISGFGIKFVQSFIEEDESLRNTQEKDGSKTSEYTRDVLTSDVKNSVPASIKLLLATLTDSIFISPSRAIDRISDTTGMATTIIDYKKLFNRMLNHLTGINRPEMIKEKLNQLATISPSELNTPLAQIRAQFKKVYEGVYNKNLTEASVEDLKLIAKFTSSVSKQKPNFMRMKINSQSGGSYFVNELFETDLRKFEKDTLDGIRSAQFLLKKKKFWLRWVEGNFRVMTNNLPKEIGKDEDVTKLLSDRLPLLGITQFTKERISSLDDVSQNKLLFNYNEAIHFLGENKRSINSKELSLYKLGIQKPIQNIGLLFAEIEFDESDPMHLNPNGEAQQNVIDNNWPSLLLSDVANFETKEEFINAHPYYNDVFVKHSLLLDKLFEEKDLSKRLNKLSILSGIEKDGNGKTMSSATQPELFVARLNAGLETSQRKAIFSLLENADGNIDWGLQTGNYVNTSQVYNGELRDILFNYLQDEMATALEFIQDGDSLKKDNAELNITLKNWNRQKGSSLQIFLNLLPKDTVELLHSTLDDLGDTEGEPHELVSKALNGAEDIKDIIYDSFMKDLVGKQVDTDIAYLQREGYIRKNKGDNYTFFQLDDNLNKKEGFTLQEIKNLLTLRKVNYSIHNIEMFKVFFGAPAYYKDPMKRFKSFISPALTTINSDEFNTALERVFNEGISELDEAYHYVGDSLTFFSVPDVKVFNELLSEVNPAYESSESTDGQMAMRLRGFKELFWKSGAKWTTQQEEELQLHEAYERQKRKSYIYTSKDLENKDLTLLQPYRKGTDYELPALAYINIIKPIQRGFKQGDAAIPSLLKTSMYPLTYYGVKGTKMENIYEQLVKTNTHAYGYASAHKVGQPISSSIISRDGGMITDLETVATREEVPFWTIGIQVETQSQKDISTAGTQIMKIIAADLYDAGVPHDFDTDNTDLLNRFENWNSLPEEEKLKNESYRLEQGHFKALSKLFNLNYTEFLDDWGIIETINPDTNQPEFTYENKDKIYDKIEKYLTRNGVPDNVLNQMQKDENGNIPIELMADYKLVKYIIYSMVDKGVLSPKLHGGQKIQMSSAFMDGLDNTYEIWWRTSKKDKYKKRGEGEEIPEGADYVIANTALKFYKKGEVQADGTASNTSRMEVLLSSRMKSKINEWREKRKMPLLSEERLMNWLNEPDNVKLLEGIGFRIPTQEMASIDAFTIKGFLPESMGDAIAVPSELPTKAGSDFDVDKLNTYLNNYRINSRGFPEYIQTFDTKEQFDTHYSEVFLQELEDYVKDIEGRVVRTANFLKIVQDVVFGLTDQDTIDHYTPIIREKMGLDDDTVSLEDNMMSRLEKYGKKIGELNDWDIQNALMEKFLKNTYRKSVENEYFQSLSDIILSPITFEKLLSPNNVDEFTNEGGHLDSINKIKGVQSENKVYNPTTMLDEQYMIRSRNIFLKAKQQVGISAVSGSNTSNFQKIPTFLVPKAPNPLFPNFVWDDITGSNYLRFAHNSISLGDSEYATLSRIGKVDGSNILRYKSKYTNGAVDVTRNDWLVRFGASEQAFAVAVLAEGLGYNTDDIALMINHPLVKEYIRLKALRGSSVYEQNDELKKKYADLYSDSSYVEFFLKDLDIANKFVIPNTYTQADISKIKGHISTAGGEHLYSAFKEKFLKEDYDKELAITVLQEFLRLKQNGTDLRMNIDASNHETVNLNSNYISKLKDSKSNVANKKTIRSIVPHEDGFVVRSLAEGLRKSGVANRLAENLAKTENFLYENIFFSKYESLVDRIVAQLTNDDEKEVFLDDARNQAEQFESSLITSTLHSTRIPTTFDGFEGITSENINSVFKISEEPSSVYQFIIKQKELNQTKTPNRKVKEGTYILDFISLRPITEESEYFYLQVNNKPSQSDIFASNQFFESVRNLKERNPKVYSALMLASILQSGNNFDRNNITSYMMHEDYLEFSKALNDITLNEDFFKKLSRVFVQNNFRKDNGVTTKVEGKLATPFFINTNKPEWQELKNNRIGEKYSERTGNTYEGSIEKQDLSALVFTPDKTGKLSDLVVFPKASWGPTKEGKNWVQKEMFNKYVQRPYLTGKAKIERTYTAENGDVITTQAPYEFLLERVPINISINDVEYTVFQHLPAKGTTRHLEANINKVNSEFNTNQKVDYKTPQEIRQTLEFLYGAENVIDNTRFEEQLYQDVSVAPAKVKIKKKPKGRPKGSKNKAQEEGPTPDISDTASGRAYVAATMAGEKLAPVNIYFSSGENADLSNFAERPFIHDNGLTSEDWYAIGRFHTIEGAFQAQKQGYTSKATDKERQDNKKIVDQLRIATGAEAKALGKKIKGLDVDDWNNDSSENMKKLIKESFQQNPEAAKRLLATGNAQLTHTQEKGKWGTEFPELLMQVREKLRNPSLNDSNTIAKGPEEGMPDLDLCEDAPF